MNQATDLLIAVLAAMSLTPLGFFFPCLPCCEQQCGVADGKSRTDPANEGTWVPSGTWRGVGGVTWTFTANPGDDSGETWFFYGSSSTSRPGGGASVDEQFDYGNICNWYSNKTTSPSVTTGLPGAFDKRASRLPPSDAVIHVYSSISTDLYGPAIVKNAYFWTTGTFRLGSEITATSSAHDSSGGCVLLNANGSGNRGTINGGATFNSLSRNFDTGVVNGGAVFNSPGGNEGEVNDGAVFNESSANGLGAVVNGGATFNDIGENVGTVNGGATFNDSSINDSAGTVNGGAVFNDSACSRRFVGSFFSTPCNRVFVAHPTDVPTCNGVAPSGCVSAFDVCGCG